MESVYTKWAPYGIKNECARTDIVFFPISEVCDGTVSLSIVGWSQTSTSCRKLSPKLFNICYKANFNYYVCILVILNLDHAGLLRPKYARTNAERETMSKRKVYTRASIRSMCLQCSLEETYNIRHEDFRTLSVRSCVSGLTHVCSCLFS